ncbi:hypothetical protein MSAN_01884100 [Mycena sanguinolenta]|uniref:Uncharacterized protein n=1 Tax=Mycena sanguinolenta TaxID=230812 RepID=A0A8H6XR82_9AGAR|nr:hypothetical protein MSAN_01884100 [Mycena sanguinolenta]
MILTTLISLIAAAAFAIGAPLQPQQLDVISPTITSPNASDCWTLGSVQRVTWDTTKIPPAFTGNKGMLMLGYLTVYNDSTGRQQVSENLDYRNPLANNFTIGQGHWTGIIPYNIPPRDDYFVVLFGDRHAPFFCSPALLTISTVATALRVSKS